MNNIKWYEVEIRAEEKHTDMSSDFKRYVECKSFANYDTCIEFYNKCVNFLQENRKTDALKNIIYVSITVLEKRDDGYNSFLFTRYYDD